MNPDRAWIATRKGLFEMHCRGGQWQPVAQHFLGDPVTMVLPPSPALGGRMLAALNLGHFGVKLHASDDAGAHWQELPAPAYPPQPEGAPGPKWATQLVWSLEAAHGVAWAGTLPGGLFRSDDAGASWVLQRSLWDKPERLEWFGGGYDAPGIHSICPHPGQPQQVLIGISCGGAWTTHDGGQGWTNTSTGMRNDYMPPERAGDGNVQDPHAIARCAGQPEVLWCQHHNGQWRSTDGGVLWQEITSQPGSNFGFAVAAHPHDGQTAWFVPAEADQRRIPRDGALVVGRTRDGGASFEQLRAGLPAQHCYDLVYRHGLQVHEDGLRLLMGSTTGNLWASHDAGDHWTEVSGHLPPIYALRFG
jgi:hypothetical protein